MPADKREQDQAVLAEVSRLRQEAGQRFAEHRREGKNTERGAEALRRAKDLTARADALEQRQRQTPERGGTEADEAKRDAYTGGRRAWAKPGSVAVGDVLQQVQEAQQGTLLGSLLNYAARSLGDRDGAAYQWTKRRAQSVVKAFGRSPDSGGSEKQPAQGRDANRSVAKRPAHGRSVEPEGR